MAVNIIIDDYVIKRRASLYFKESHFEQVKAEWPIESEILKELNQVSLFAGCTFWHQLDTLHFRMLVANLMNRRDSEVHEDQWFDDANPLVKQLFFMIMALIYCVENNTLGTVDTVNIVRISDLQVTFKFDVSMIPETKPKPQPGLHIVVDNTNGTNYD